MSAGEIDELKDKITQLEKEVQEREQDLAHYKGELLKANDVLKKLIRRVSKELDLVVQMQRALIPTKFPNIAGFAFSSKFLPGTQVGGDYMDLFDKEDKFRFGMVISANSGYAASANFLSSFFQLTTEKKLFLKGSNEVVEKIFSYMEDSVVDGQETHIFYGLVDRRQYKMHFSLIGEIQVLCWRHQRQELEKIGEAQPAYKVDFEEKVLEQTLSLNEKDLLIFTSQGVINVRNEKGECFGSHRLYQAILGCKEKKPHNVRNEIFYQIENFIGSQNFPCDLSVMVVESEKQTLRLV